MKTSNLLLCVFAAFLFMQKAAWAAKCVESCSKEDEPVCGSDGRTYRNGCWLSLAACRKKSTILMVHLGPCDPCTNHKCTTPPNSKCRAINGVPSCGCSYRCPRQNRIVCGSNSKTYPNECEMKKHSCSINATVTVIKRGQCGISGPGGCAALSCPGTLICRVLAGRARCVKKRRCRVFCPRIYRPICGTNGRTYSSQCVLERLACRYNKDIVRAYKGRCRALHRRCIGKICPKREVCRMVRRRPKCVRICPKACPRTYKPVCGTDGHTYSNECSLQLEACRRKAVIKISSTGRCETSTEGCNFLECELPYVCKVSSGQAKCVRRVCRNSCPRLYRPVCGTDKKTYPNECELQRTACRRNENTKIEHEGRCEVIVSSTCKLTTCVFKPYSHCEMKEGVAKCVCQRTCPSLIRPVCGTDKKTYKNDCILKLKACSTTSRINVLNEGPCAVDRCEAKNCSSHPYSSCKMRNDKPLCACQGRCTKLLRPVCGSDNRTYPNVCVMKYRSCRQKALITVRKVGRCQPKETCASKSCNFYSKCAETRSGPVCVCPTKTSCSRIKNRYAPVCGSDGLAYINNCTMQVISCEKKKKVQVVSVGKCPGTCRLGSSCPTPYYSKCSSRSGIFTCICPRFCPMKYEPVCGSDGKIYGNLCTLKMVACKANQTIVPTNFSECASNHRCANVYCPRRHVCRDLDGQPRCVSRSSCRMVCPLNSRPVCGSDGKTYSNECQLRQTACMNSSPVRKAYNGSCKPERRDPCAAISCKLYSTNCTVKNNKSLCVCPSSDQCNIRNYSPVCASDGKTYVNECFMKATGCQKKKWLKVVNAGHCNGTCLLRFVCSLPPNSECKVAQYGRITCVCPQNCTSDHNPVCGSDGKMYRNICQLKSAACNKNKTITRLELSNCVDTCESKNCSNHPYSTCKVMSKKPTCVCRLGCSKISRPVCGSDNRTYPDVCIMKYSSCRQKKLITVRKVGRCQPNQTCASKSCNFYSKCAETRSGPVCVCPTKTSCSRIKNRYAPVCGSDGLTYINNCTMQVISCEKKKNVQVVSVGKCPGTCRLGSSCPTPYYSKCSSRSGIFTCICPRFCPMKYEPVCGSDGKIYGNLCTLKMVACKANQTIVPTNFSECASNHRCANVYCPRRHVCRDLDGQPRCVSRSSCRMVCPLNSRPVCGSDGKTYSNECQLRQTACMNNSGVTKVNNGSCKL